MKRIYFALAACMAAFSFNTQAQTVIPKAGELLLPQYMVTGNSTDKRLHSLCRLRLAGLTANTTYRYYTGASTDSTLTKSLPGNFMAFNNNSNSFGYITGYSSQKGMGGTLLTNDTFNSSSGNKYAELTTDANGDYVGYFAMVPTGNAVYAAGNQVFFYVYVNDGAGGTSVSQRFRTSSTLTMLSYGSTAGSAMGSAIRGNSMAAGETPVFLYDNTAGTGRPLYGTWAESDGITVNYTNWYVPKVDTVSGAWGAVIPNTNSNGVQRIESRDMKGAVLYSHTDADGTWGSGVNTSNPTNDTVPLVITIGDAPLGAINPIVSFANTSAQVNENGSSLNVDITLTNPNSNATSVDVAVTGGTASSGSDFTYTTTTVTFPANSTTTQTITITLNDDAAVEGTETIVLALQNATNGATTGSAATTTISIVDNDAPSLSFDKTSQNAGEGSGTVNIDVNILNPDPANATTVEVAVLTGTATGGTDYTFSTTTLTFPAGSSAKQTATLTLTDDAITEGSETVVLMLQNANNSAGYVNTYDSLTITDNDFPAVSFGSSAKTVAENAGTISIDVTISNPHPTVATTVEVEVAGGNAQNGTDYDFTPQTITFPAGSTASQTATLSITDDLSFETSETIILTLKNASNNATMVVVNDTITITDNDVNQPVLSFAADTSGVLEGSIATITVNIANPAATATTVEVALGTGSTATPGTDFTFTTTTLTFPAGSSGAQTVNIPTLNNDKIVANKTVVLKLQNPSTGAALGSNMGHTLTIVENGKNSIPGVTATDDIQMYPNPARRSNVFLTAAKPMQWVRLYSANGQVVYTNTSANNAIELNTVNLPEGLYLIHILVGDKQAVLRLVVQ